METKQFISTGIVLGNLWGGGVGSYPARKLSAETREDLIKKANEGLDGSLDSGMGFERLLGALLFITARTTIEHEGKQFTNKETEEVFIGESTEEQQDFLMESSEIF